jgi:hypothetical protein
MADEQQRLIDAIAQQVVFSVDVNGVRATGSGKASGWNTMSP